jgi:hypothetical protein
MLHATYWHVRFDYTRRRLLILCLVVYLLQVGDFGIGKFFPEDVTHIETRVMGTHGCVLVYCFFFFGKHHLHACDIMI